MPIKELENLKILLRQLFQLDKTDLDFGIYRIMNIKRNEVEEFIDEILPQKIEEIKAKINDSKIEEARTELKIVKKELIDNYGEKFEENAENFLNVQIFNEKYKKYLNLTKRVNSTDFADSMESDLYNDLYRFFERYYDNGDFVTKPRAGDKSYMIPYNGEETKLYWSSFDQYYIKTGENFKNYIFNNGASKHKDLLTVEYRLEEAEVSQNNNKADKKSVFIPTENFFEWIPEENKLNIYFYYKVPTQEEKQKWGVKQSIKTDNKGINEQLILSLESKIRETKNTELARFWEKNTKKIGKDTKVKDFYYHLNRFTSLNESDYFIHKNLSKFLFHELDYFLKNEIFSLNFMNLIADEDYMNETIKSNTVRAFAIKDIATSIIGFLSELENFQKKLFEKKKFVVASDYCLTLDRLPPAISNEVIEYIIKDSAQIEDWVSLGYVNAKDVVDKKFLTEKETLVIDTKFLSEDLKYRVIDSIEDLEKNVNGLLVNSENWQGLRLLESSFKEKIKCIYIDPPYNTDQRDFLYKDNYKHSSWISMMRDRISLAHKLLKKDGTIAVSIDNNEISNVMKILDDIFGEENRVALPTVKRGSVTGHKAINPGVVNITEYVVMYCKDKASWKPKRVYKARGRNDRYNRFILNRDKDINDWEFTTLLDAFADYLNLPKQKLKKELGSQFEERIFSFIKDNSNAVVQLAYPDFDKVSRETQNLINQSKKNSNQIFYQKREQESDIYLHNGQRLLFYSDRLRELDGQLVTVEALSDIWDDILPNDLHNEGGVELKKGKKSESLIKRILEITTEKDDYVLDFFVGSGTSTAVAHKMERKYIGIEMAEYFNSKTLNRMKNTLFGEQKGISKSLKYKGSGVFNYIKLEQYEDSLNNIQFDEELPELPFEERIKYIINHSANNSSSLLNIKKFETPFDYYMEIINSNERELRKIDLVATFNLLLGINVNQTISKIENGIKYRIILGEKLEELYCIIWRDFKSEIDLEQEREWIYKQSWYRESSTLYCNADNAIKALSIEKEFKYQIYKSI